MYLGVYENKICYTVMNTAGQGNQIKYTTYEHKIVVKIIIKEKKANLIA